MKRHSGKHPRYCFKIGLMQEKKMKYVQKLLIIVYRKKGTQIEPLVMYRKNNSKKHFNPLTTNVPVI